MRLNARRMTVGAAMLLAGLFALAAASEAADIPDDVVKSLVDQDAKHIENQLNMGKPKAKSLIPIKSSAMMIAAFAQSKITGKDPGNDTKYATLRDKALKLSEAMKMKKYDDALKIVKELSVDIKPDPTANTKAKELHTLFGFDMNELMGQYRKLDPKDGFGGLNIELDIKAFARQKLPKPEQAAAIASRVLLTSEFVEKMEPDAGFAGGKKTKEAWLKWNKEMNEAAKELAEMSKAPKVDGKKLQAAFGRLDSKCVGCHDIFKVTSN